MLLANGLYAIFDSLAWFVSWKDTAHAIYITFQVLEYFTNLVGLIVLTHCLCKLCDIQIQYEALGHVS